MELNIRNMNFAASEKKKVFLSLGTNQGNREENLEHARRQINDELGDMLKTSGCYNTAAWGNEDQDWFLNQVILIATELVPADLLDKILALEKKMGRLASSKGNWAPRPIDIDILYYEDFVLQTPSLTIPHPRIQDRKFVLVPLAEIAPDFTHPKLLKSNTELLGACTDRLYVSLTEELDGNI